MNIGDVVLIKDISTEDNPFIGKVIAKENFEEYLDEFNFSPVYTIRVERPFWANGYSDFRRSEEELDLISECAHEMER